jgi:hypothetical protein
MTMNPPSQATGLPPELRDTFEMIRAAFPEGVSESVYRPLLALLYEGMSFRGVAGVVAYCTGRPYSLVYNDVLGAVSPYTPDRPDQTQLESVRRQLREHGYDEWLTKE